MNFGNSTECKDCKRLQSGLTWTGNKPPKCPKHSEHSATYVGSPW